MIRNLLAFFSLALTSCAVNSDGAGRPNLLVIMADDQGVGDVGYNNPLVDSPVVDRLASESAVFTDFIAAPACTPSRASFLTGRNHYHVGVWGVGPRGYMNRDEVLFPEFLRRAGYCTAHFGKWEGLTPELQAHRIGYDETGALAGGYQHKNPEMMFNGESRQMSGWTTDILADLTIDFIERQAADEAPWVAVTAYISPHGPWVCDLKFSDPLEAKGYSAPLAAIWGMVKQMDVATGRILSTLDRLGIRDNTIVIYVSDNGPTPAPGTPMDGEDWTQRNPWKLKGRKSFVWENGIRVPFMICWPGVIPAGARSQLGAIEDVLPTVLDLAGVSPDVVGRRFPFDGISLKPVLMDASAPAAERTYFRLPIAPPGMPLPEEMDPIGIINDSSKLDYDGVHAVLYGVRYKLHHLPSGKSALYDIQKDPGETTDLSEEYPEKTAEMAAACLEEWNRLIHSSYRTLTMPYFLIGDPRYEGIPAGPGRYIAADTVPGDAPLTVDGDARSPYGFRGAGGFRQVGDRISYGINVITSGEYQVIVKGDHLDRCLPMELVMDGNVITPQNIHSQRMDFGQVFFDPGKHRLVFSPIGEKDDAEEGVIRSIEFRKENTGRGRLPALN